MNPKIVILGGGPSALFAYYGALQMGYQDSEVEVWAKEPSYPPGAFWLHQTPLGGFIPHTIAFYFAGNAETYSIKQWGAKYESSWDKYQLLRQTTGYNPHAVLPQLWKDVNLVRTDRKFDAPNIEDLARDVKLVVQTFSTNPNFKQVANTFAYPVYSAEKDIFSCSCQYNGEEAVPWVRKTIAFGRVSVEYPATWRGREEEIKQTWDAELQVSGTVSLVPDLHPAIQPLPHRILGERENILLVGRWATLDRKCLSHNAQSAVRTFLHFMR